MLLIDTANLSEIEKALKALPLIGVTTCPTIIVKEKRNIFDILKDIRNLIGDNRMLHAQVMADTPDGILRDAVALREHVSGDFYVKVPVTLAGFQAMPLLKKEGIDFTATTIHSTAQAILDARALYPESSLTDLYDELTMPAELRKAHQENDRAVMQAYGFPVKSTFTESQCVAELFKRYQELVISD